MLALVLRPVVRASAKRGIPNAVTGLLLVAALLCVFGAGAYCLSTPIASWIKRAPDIAQEIDAKLSTLKRPVDALAKAGDQVQAIAEGGGGAAEAAPQKVVLTQPGLLARAASGATDIIARLGLTFILLLFLLASGDLFYEKTVKVLPSLSDKKTALRILHDIEHEVSRYLLTITGINTSVGIGVAVIAYFVGMPTPLLWGVVAAICNFIPYIGPLMGISIVAAAAVVSFDTIAHAAIAPAAYLALIVLEGQFLTPIVVGRRLQLNEVSIFIGMAFWGWLWGLMGALLAVPALVVFRIFAAHVEPLQP